MEWRAAAGPMQEDSGMEAMVVSLGSAVVETMPRWSVVRKCIEGWSVTLADPVNQWWNCAVVVVVVVVIAKQVERRQ